MDKVTCTFFYRKVIVAIVYIVIYCHFVLIFTYCLYSVTIVYGMSKDNKCVPNFVMVLCFLFFLSNYIRYSYLFISFQNALNQFCGCKTVLSLHKLTVVV